MNKWLQSHDIGCNIYSSTVELKSKAHSIVDAHNLIYIFPKYFRVTSYWARWRLKSPACRSLAYSIVQTQITEIKLRVTGLCEVIPPVTGGFPSQEANNAENISIW